MTGIWSYFVVAVTKCLSWLESVRELILIPDRLLDDKPVVTIKQRQYHGLRQIQKDLRNLQINLILKNPSWINLPLAANMRYRVNKQLSMLSEQTNIALLREICKFRANKRETLTRIHDFPPRVCGLQNKPELLFSNKQTKKAMKIKKNFAMNFFSVPTYSYIKLGKVVKNYNPMNMESIYDIKAARGISSLYKINRVYNIYSQWSRIDRNIYLALKSVDLRKLAVRSFDTLSFGPYNKQIYFLIKLHKEFKDTKKKQRLNFLKSLANDANKRHLNESLTVNNEKILMESEVIEQSINIPEILITTDVKKELLKKNLDVDYWAKLSVLLDEFIFTFNVTSDTVVNFVEENKIDKVFSTSAKTLGSIFLILSVNAPIILCLIFLISTIFLKRKRYNLNLKQTTLLRDNAAKLLQTKLDKDLPLSSSSKSLSRDLNKTIDFNNDTELNSSIEDIISASRKLKNNNLDTIVPERELNSIIRNVEKVELKGSEVNEDVNQNKRHVGFAVEENEEVSSISRIKTPFPGALPDLSDENSDSDINLEHNQELNITRIIAPDDTIVEKTSVDTAKASAALFQKARIAASPESVSETDGLLNCAFST